MKYRNTKIWKFWKILKVWTLFASQRDTAAGSPPFHLCSSVPPSPHFSLSSSRRMIHISPSPLMITDTVMVFLLLKLIIGNTGFLRRVEGGWYTCLLEVLKV